MFGPCLSEVIGVLVSSSALAHIDPDPVLQTNILA